ncbi:alpha/beta fold hydrolase [Paenibacillus sp. SI8]|uniref:alpha/beta fold hydrolase n=1 Tax=unclassified Paenibacillus TaxID=185978 RepID=UPI00346748D1
MSTYVFVHGAWQGAWCWEKLSKLLRENGHTVIAEDLPGHGADQTPVSELSLEKYVESVVQAIDSQNESVYLLGHSMGGVVISQVAEHRPDKIKALIYLSAYLLKNGETLTDAVEKDKWSLVPSNLVFAPDYSHVEVKPEAVKELFFGDCSEEEVAWAAQLIRPEAVKPFRHAVSLTEENYGKVDRVYIETLQDHAVSNGLQKLMYAATSCKQIITLDSGHSSFLSETEGLAKHLMTL